MTTKKKAAPFNLPLRQADGIRNCFILAPSADPNIRHVVAKADSSESAARIVRAVSAEAGHVAMLRRAYDYLCDDDGFHLSNMKDEMREMLRAAGEEV